MLPRFPLVGVVLWCAGYSIGMVGPIWAFVSSQISSLAFASLTVFFSVPMVVAALALFFGSDYAQQKWNPEGE